MRIRRQLLPVALIAGVALNATAAAKTPSSQPAVQPIHVKVLVLDFDPRIPQENNERLSKVGGWNDPRTLADGYIKDVREASHGILQYDIVEWNEIDAFHQKVDGFTYTPEQYMANLRAGKGWHEPDTADYPGTFEKFNVIPRIDSGEIDEVWFFGAPYFGYNESAMAGPGAFYINGAVYDKVKSKRPFAIMGFNYERGVAEMVHDLCHRTESTMGRVYGGWKVDELTNNWARFAANALQSNGQASVGTCHYPPNAKQDYDYSNPRVVQSTADDWLNYPRLTGARTPVSSLSWKLPYKNRDGNPDYHRNYMSWWFQRLPHAAGTNADGRLNNWWEYIFHFNDYDESGKPRR
jgi:hypothetical protein